MQNGITSRFPSVKLPFPFADNLKQMRTLLLILLVGVLLLVPGTTRAGDIELVENSTQWAITQGMAVDIYDRIVRQMKRIGLPVEVTPRIRIHCITRKEDDQILTDCLQGGCGYLLRIITRNKKRSGPAFIGISEDGVQIWLTKPDGLLMAMAITLSLNYENRLHLEPPAFSQIAVTAWRTHMLNQRWKVSASDLKKGR